MLAAIADMAGAGGFVRIIGEFRALSLCSFSRVGHFPDELDARARLSSVFLFDLVLCLCFAKVFNHLGLVCRGLSGFTKALADANLGSDRESLRPIRQLSHQPAKFILAAERLGLRRRSRRARA